MTAWPPLTESSKTSGEQATGPPGAKDASWHLTASQAGRIAAESGARLLVLTHFSQRYEHDGGQPLATQAATAFGGPVVLAHDLNRIPVPSRHTSAT